MSVSGTPRCSSVPNAIGTVKAGFARSAQQGTAVVTKQVICRSPTHHAPESVATPVDKLEGV